MDPISKYIDAINKVLDPSKREIEPAAGDRGFGEMLVRNVNLAERTVEAVVSNAEIDRYQEIVDPKAFKPWLKVFLRNPVLMPAHQYMRPDAKPAQIGAWLEMKVADEGLVGTAWFDEDETADAWFKKYSHPDKKKRARAFSVGFIAHSWEMREFELEAGVRKRLRVFTEVELLEVSTVPIPANRGALARAASASADPAQRGGAPLIPTDELKELIGDAVRTAVSKQLDADLNGRLASLIESVVEAYQRHEAHAHHHHDDAINDRQAPAGGNDRMEAIGRALSNIIGT